MMRFWEARCEVEATNALCLSQTLPQHSLTPSVLFFE